MWKATDVEFDYLHRCIKKLRRHPLGIAFLHPVDPISDSAPNYFDIVKHPMDLTTIYRKLESREYTDAAAVMADINLMWDNTMLYNPDTTTFYHCAKRLKGKCDKWFLHIPLTPIDMWHIGIERRRRTLEKVIEAGLLKQNEIPFKGNDW